MKTLVCLEPGKLQYADVVPPVLQPGHAIVKIKRIGICGTDLHAVQGTQPYFTYPRILGHELAGDLVEADGTSGFVPGEALSFIPYLHCNSCIACNSGKPNCCVRLKVFGVHMDGGMAAYVSVPTANLIKAGGLDYDELALIEPLAIGAHAIRRAQPVPKEFVLVTGAGPIGLATLAFARLRGSEVIVMDTNAQRLEFCRNEWQVPHTIQSTRENAMEKLLDITNGNLPTLIFDATGNLHAINESLQYLAHGGRIVLIGLQKEPFSFSHPAFHQRETTLMSSRNATREDFESVKSAIQTGLILPKKLITHRTPFSALGPQLTSWASNTTGLIKAMVTME